MQQAPLTKRQEIDRYERIGLLGIINAAFSKWGYQLKQNASTEDDTKKYMLMLCAPAGDSYRYRGILPCTRSLHLQHPWCMQEYANSETTSWSNYRFWADRKEDLIPPSYKLLWAVGVTFFIFETARIKQVFSIPQNYEREVIVNAIPPTSVFFKNGAYRVECDLTTEKGIERAFALTTQHGRNPFP